MRAKISQREARALRKRVKALEERLRGFVAPGGDTPGTFFWSLTCEEQRMREQFTTVSRLGYAVLVKCQGSTLSFYAVKS